MRQASTALKNFFASTPNMVKPDLYTITLSGGAVHRWTSADIPITSGGQIFQPVAGLTDSGVTLKRGVQVDSLSVTMSADERHTINGLPLIQFVHRGGLDGANILIQRAFATDWIDLESNGPVGTITRFGGRFSEVRDGGSTEVTISATSWLELLNVMMPPDVFQASCLNTVFDGKCGLNRSTYQATGTVTAATDSRTDFDTSLSMTSGYYNSGAILFTSGANAGQRRTIRTQNSAGNLVLVSPLPALPQAGDAFQVWPGCDLKLATCVSKFNNKLRFRGQPFIPVPETSL